MKTGLNELMQIYTIKIVAGAYGRVPTIVGFDLTRLHRESFIYSPALNVTIATQQKLVMQ